MRKLALLALAACSCAWAPAATSPSVRPATGSAPETDPAEAAAMVLEAQDAPAEPEASAVREGFAWWDFDGDGVLTEDELTEIWVAHLDVNRDGVIEPSEWPAG